MADIRNARVFVEPTERFSLSVPEGWLLDTSGQQGSRVVLFAPGVEDSFRANVNVVVQDLTPLSRDEYITLGRLQLKKLSNLAALEVDQPASGPLGGHWLGWSTWEAPIPIRARQLVVFREQQAFVITAMSSSASFPGYELLFRDILESFKFTAPGQSAAGVDAVFRT